MFHFFSCQVTYPDNYVVFSNVVQKCLNFDWVFINPIIPKYLEVVIFLNARYKCNIWKLRVLFLRECQETIRYL